VNHDKPRTDASLLNAAILNEDPKTKGLREHMLRALYSATKRNEMIAWLAEDGQRWAQRFKNAMSRLKQERALRLQLKADLEIADRRIDRLRQQVVDLERVAKMRETREALNREALLQQQALQHNKVG